MLRDGNRVVVRRMRDGDESLVRDVFEGLGEESRYRRFLAPVNELSEEDLRYLTEVDHRRHEAVIAIEPDSGTGLGVARYVLVPGDRESAEVSVAVVDDWQGRGIGTELMTRLNQRAREQGVRRYTALVSPDNELMIGLLAEAGAERRPGEDSNLEFALPIPSNGLGERLRDALRGAAQRHPGHDFVSRLKRR